MMRTSTIQFAPSRRPQEATPCRRRTVYFSSAKETRRLPAAAALTNSARNVRTTAKLILLLWVVSMAAAFWLRTNPADSEAMSLSSQSEVSHQNVTGVIREHRAE